MPQSLRVLIVEDSEDDTLLLTRELHRANFDLQYRRVDCSEAMGAALDTERWDLVLADFSMPNFRGDAALAMLRARGLDIPFIFVSGTIGEEAAVAAMRVGASDYIIKGSFKRLIPAIERELHDSESRRKRRQAEEALKSPMPATGNWWKTPPTEFIARRWKLALSRSTPLWWTYSATAQRKNCCRWMWSGKCIRRRRTSSG